VIRRPTPILSGVNAVGVALWLFICIFPFFWMVLISFRLPVDAFSVPPKLIAPMTLHNYYTVWLVDGFWRFAVNTIIVTFFTVLVSLAVACPAGYALSRYRGSLGFWLLSAALIFRAMPHVVLLTAYRPAFFALGLWSRYETLIIVLVAINQPFTIWMLRAFFMNIPKELDEAALIDGCSRFQAFRLAIMPVMWPGLVTAGLFAFLLAYNDFVISSQMMNGEMMTMTAALGNYMGQSRHLDKLMLGIAGAVSVIIPILILIFAFQRQIVSGMTQGAVKG
jgi:ABC-type glycerol-3-phosphate transport system permease component